MLWRENPFPLVGTFMTKHSTKRSTDCHIQCAHWIRNDSALLHILRICNNPFILSQIFRE
jgi:hypothetical protein